MKTTSILTASLFAMCVVAAPVCAHGSHEHGVAISGGWARETAQGQKDGGGFLTITNNAGTLDRLVSASSSVAAQTQIHSMTMDQGIMRMRQVVGGLVVPAHGTLELKPGGYHIMLIGLRHPLRAGETVKLVLRFEHSGDVPARLAVEPAGATGPDAQPAMHGMGTMNMGGMDMHHGG